MAQRGDRTPAQLPADLDGVLRRHVAPLHESSYEPVDLLVLVVKALAQNAASLSGSAASKTTWVRMAATTAMIALEEGAGRTYYRIGIAPPRGGAAVARSAGYSCILPQIPHPRKSTLACPHTPAALAVLLGLDGLQVSEACATNIEDLGLERGHCILRILAKGSKPAPSRSFPHPPHHRPRRR